MGTFFARVAVVMRCLLGLLLACHHAPAPVVAQVAPLPRCEPPAATGKPPLVGVIARGLPDAVETPWRLDTVRLPAISPDGARVLVAQVDDERREVLPLANPPANLVLEQHTVDGDAIAARTSVLSDDELAAITKLSGDEKIDAASKLAGQVHRRAYNANQSMAKDSWQAMTPCKRRFEYHFAFEPSPTTRATLQRLECEDLVITFRENRLLVRRGETTLIDRTFGWKVRKFNGIIDGFNTIAAAYVDRARGALVLQVVPFFLQLGDAASQSMHWHALRLNENGSRSPDCRLVEPK
jgi:hypothetical protein